jgi:hypothetical protein
VVVLTVVLTAAIWLFGTGVLREANIGPAHAARIAHAAEAGPGLGSAEAAALLLLNLRRPAPLGAMASRSPASPCWAADTAWTPTRSPNTSTTWSWSAPAAPACAPPSAWPRRA